ncbi:MAG: hypothetical protein RIC14_03975 [Filomicrobium sp.]
MNILRKVSLCRRFVAILAIAAMLMHVGVFSLHVSASIERGFSQSQVSGAAEFDIHAFCGIDLPADSQALSTDGQAPEGNRSSSGSNCLVCIGAAAAHCLSTPAQVALAVVSFNTDQVHFAVGDLSRSTPEGQTSGTIRGPPTLV